MAEPCPPDMAFVDLVEGRLAEPEAAALRSHAEGCERCRAALGALADAPPPGIEATAPARAGTGAGIARALLGEGAAGALVGRMVDRTYRLDRFLGAGGMGSVYEATHAETGRRVAVKLLDGRLLRAGADAAGRFRREARTVGAIDSPHVVAVLDAGEDEDTGDRYLVMELLHGEDVQSLLDRVGPLLPEVALRIAAQALVGLQKAHAARIVHRDIKPANLFLVRGDDGAVTVKLLDFGIAKVAADGPFAATAGGLVKTEGLLGSPLYMSPEQVQSSGDVDLRTDLWSMGSVLYYALAGRAPFADAASLGFGKLIVSICGSAPPPVRRIAPWVPPEAAAVVARALTIDRELRYPSAAAMLAAVQALVPGGLALREDMLTGVPLDRRAAVRPSRSLPRWRLLAGSAAACIALAIAAWLTRSPPPPSAALPTASARELAPAPPPVLASPPASAPSAPVLPPVPSASTPRPRSLPPAPAHTPTRVVPAAPTTTAATAPAAPTHKPGVVEDPPF